MKTSTKIIILLSIIIVSVLGGYFYAVHSIQKSSLLINAPLDNISKQQTVSNKDDWKTYSSDKNGFEVNYPKDTKITDSDQVAGRSISFDTPQGMFRVDVVDKAWHDGVLSAPPSCDDNASGQARTNTNINGLDYFTYNMSRIMSGHSPFSATEYCTVRGNVAYKLITSVGYAPGTSDGVDLDKNETLNRMVASFKLKS